MCFSVTNTETLNSAVSKYIPEVNHHCPDTPIILVGTKIELREDPVTLQRLQAYNKAAVNEESVICIKETSIIFFTVLITFIRSKVSSKNKKAKAFSW